MSWDEGHAPKGWQGRGASPAPGKRPWGLMLPGARWHARKPLTPPFAAPRPRRPLAWGEAPCRRRGDAAAPGPPLCRAAAAPRCALRRARRRASAPTALIGRCLAPSPCLPPAVPHLPGRLRRGRHRRRRHGLRHGAAGGSGGGRGRMGMCQGRGDVRTGCAALAQRRLPAPAAIANAAPPPAPSRMPAPNPSPRSARVSGAGVLGEGRVGAPVAWARSPGPQQGSAGTCAASSSRPAPCQNKLSPRCHPPPPPSPQPLTPASSTATRAAAAASPGRTRCAPPPAPGPGQACALP
jgi:hypothetical protein